MKKIITIAVAIFIALAITATSAVSYEILEGETGQILRLEARETLSIPVDSSTPEMFYTSTAVKEYCLSQGLYEEWYNPFSKTISKTISARVFFKFRLLSSEELLLLWTSNDNSLRWSFVSEMAITNNTDSAMEIPAELFIIQEF